MGAYLQLTITDTADPASGSEALNPFARVVRTAWCHLPMDWLVDGRLPSGRRAALVEGLVGSERRPRRGRLVLRVEANVLTPAQARTRPWLDDIAGFYRCGPDGVLREVVPAEL